TIQGYLENNGAPAQGAYDIELDIYSTPGGDAGLIAPDLFFTGVNVTDGLFSIEVLPQFQISPQGWQQITTLPDVSLQFAFRPTGSGETPTPMAARPRLASAPRASMAYDLPANLKPWT